MANPAISADSPLIAFNCSDFSVTALRASIQESNERSGENSLSISLLSFSNSLKARSSSLHLYSQAISAPWDRVDKISIPEDFPAKEMESVAV
jgi:hypothetical protein